MELSPIEGAISLKAVLETGTREISEIYIRERKPDKDLRYILRLAEEKGLKPNFVSEKFFEENAQGKTHGGILAFAGERKFVPEDALFEDENPMIALLEGIEDPYNFGCAVRSLYAAGATGLLLPERNWMSAAGTVIRSSAGASERIKAAKTENLPGFLQKAKQHGIKIICAERKDAVSLYSADLTGGILLAIGGEKRGVSKAVFDAADSRVFIPYGRDFRNSISASAASAVFAFEILRQRQKNKAK